MLHMSSDRVQIIHVPVPSSPAPAARGMHMDAWQNVVAGFGTTRDRMQAGTYVADAPLDPGTLSAMYYGETLAAKIVDSVVKSAFQKGYKLKAKDEKDAEEFFNWAQEKHSLNTKIAQAAIWGRLFGGCLLIIGAVDGGKLSEPLNEKAVKSVDFILSVDCRYAFPQTYYTELGPKMMEPETYRVQVQTAYTSTTLIVHESRCIRFGGTPADDQKRRELRGWDFSVLQRPYAELRAFGTSLQGVSNMMAEASQPVYTIKGLMSMLAGGNKQALMERMQLMDYGRSINRAIVLDEGEKFEKVASPFSGISETVDRQMQIVSSAAETPVSILFGRGPAGMNATGDMDMQAWHGQVGAYSLHTLEPKIKRALYLLSLDKTAPTKGKPLVDVKYEWHPLHVPTDAEQATAYSTRANADAVYIDRGVFDPAAVAIARAGRGTYSADVPRVDVEALERQLEAREEFDEEAIEAEKAKLAEQTPGEPPPANTPPANGTPPAAPANVEGDDDGADDAETN